MAEWSRIANTTIHEFIREEEINILRNRKLLNLLKERGRISFNHSGDIMDWKIRYRRAALRGFAMTDTLTFAPQDRWKTAQLPWRGYAIPDSILKREKLLNRSTEAIIKVFEGMAKRLMEDVEDAFGEELYVDGTASGNSKRLHGIESFLAATAQSGNFVGLPNATYAGIATNLGQFGGTWGSGTWPNGTGDSNYDFWSPLIVDTTNTAWGAGTKTWANTCVEALRFGILNSQRNASKRGRLDLILLERNLFRQWLAQTDSKERIVIDRGSKADGSQQTGFSGSQNFDGVEIDTEYGLPVNVGYGFNIQQMELRSVQENLFVPEGPDFDISSQAYRMSVDTLCNLRFNPRFFVAFKPLS